MNQVGTVVEVLKDDKAKVLMRKHSACGDCGACQYGKENMQMNIVASNDISAKEGDTVEVDMESHDVLGAAFIIYVVPLVILVGGIMGSHFFLKNIESINTELYSALIGVILMTISFLVIKNFEGSFQRSKKYIPTIKKVL